MPLQIWDVIVGVSAKRPYSSQYNGVSKANSFALAAALSCGAGLRVSCNIGRIGETPLQFAIQWDFEGEFFCLSCGDEAREGYGKRAITMLE